MLVCVNACVCLLWQTTCYFTLTVGHSYCQPHDSFHRGPHHLFYLDNQMVLFTSTVTQTLLPWHSKGPFYLAHLSSFNVTTWPFLPWQPYGPLHLVTCNIIHSHNKRHILHVPKYNWVTCPSTFKYCATHHWDSLDSCIMEAPSLDSYKKSWRSTGRYICR